MCPWSLNGPPHVSKGTAHTASSTLWVLVCGHADVLGHPQAMGPDDLGRVARQVIVVAGEEGELMRRPAAGPQAEQLFYGRTDVGELEGFEEPHQLRRKAHTVLLEAAAKPVKPRPSEQSRVTEVGHDARVHRPQVHAERAGTAVVINIDRVGPRYGIEDADSRHGGRRHRLHLEQVVVLAHQPDQPVHLAAHHNLLQIPARIQRGDNRPGCHAGGLARRGRLSRGGGLARLR